MIEKLDSFDDTVRPPCEYCDLGVETSPCTCFLGDDDDDYDYEDEEDEEV